MIRRGKGLATEAQRHRDIFLSERLIAFRPHTRVVSRTLHLWNDGGHGVPSPTCQIMNEETGECNVGARPRLLSGQRPDSTFMGTAGTECPALPCAGRGFMVYSLPRADARAGSIRMRE